MHHDGDRALSYLGRGTMHCRSSKKKCLRSAQRGPSPDFACKQLAPVSPPDQTPLARGLGHGVALTVRLSGRHASHFALLASFCRNTSPISVQNRHRSRIITSSMDSCPGNPRRQGRSNLSCLLQLAHTRATVTITQRKPLLHAPLQAPPSPVG